MSSLCKTNVKTIQHLHHDVEIHSRKSIRWGLWKLRLLCSQNWLFMENLINCESGRERLRRQRRDYHFLPAESMLFIFIARSWQSGEWSLLGVFWVNEQFEQTFWSVPLLWSLNQCSSLRSSLKPTTFVPTLQDATEQVDIQHLDSSSQ